MKKWRAISADARSSIGYFARRTLFIVGDFARSYRRELLVSLVLAIIFALIVERGYKYWEKTNEARVLRHIKDAVATIVAYSKDDRPVSLGCGVFFEPDGRLVTNYQVVKTPKVEARLTSGAYYKLRISFEKTLALALLSCNSTGEESRM